MSELFLKIAAFLLGFKHKSYQEHEKEGRRIRLSMINDNLRRKIPNSSLKEIYLIGAIEFSESELDLIRNTLMKGETVDFKFPEFDPAKDYMNFYQVSTDDGKYFICALSDKKQFRDLDKSLMIVEIKRELSIAHLPNEARYK